MRLLHTADIHLGKKLGEIPLLKDQRVILGRIADIASRRSCDAVLISGDIYQNTSPSADAMEAFGEFLSCLAERGIAVIAIAGNHDSDQRVAYMSQLVRESGIFIAERFSGRLQKIPFSKNGESVVFWLLPFIRPSDVRRYYPDREIGSYNDAVRTVMENAPVDPDEVNIILAHQFITGASVSESEEITVGGLDNVDSSVFDGFDYAALGHLHRPQSAGRDTVRYAGSPMKYSISEANDEKSVVLIEINGRSITTEKVSLQPVHDVRNVKGFLREIMDMPYSEDYVRVEINDEDVPPDARISVVSVFPNMVRFAVVNSKTSMEMDIDFSGAPENRSPLELFSDFYTAQNNDVPPDERRLAIMREVIEEAAGTDETR
ncbi:MAG: exonuclease SbcCD subunit D [Oscillospiraceae bacterium]|nr:exonuclease SbcCD subunit D [Oscillospiraceae bacterium]